MKTLLCGLFLVICLLLFCFVGNVERERSPHPNVTISRLSRLQRLWAYRPNRSS